MPTLTGTGGQFNGLLSQYVEAVKPVPSSELSAIVSYPGPDDNVGFPLRIRMLGDGMYPK